MNMNKKKYDKKFLNLKMDSSFSCFFKVKFMLQPGIEPETPCVIVRRPLSHIIQIQKLLPQQSNRLFLSVNANYFCLVGTTSRRD